MNLKEKLKDPIFELVSKIADELCYPTYIVGGWVRDYFLKRDLTDMDFVCVGDSSLLAKRISDFLPGSKFKIFKRFGTAHISHQGKIFEFVSARKESYQINSRNPDVQAGTLLDDQNRRDFTINSMAIQLNKIDFGKLEDPFNALEDIKKKILKTPLNPDRTYQDDPLRMMRAIRFASQLNFKIEKESLDSIKKNSHRIQIISQERITEEVNKILLTPKPSIGLELLFNCNLLHEFFQEMVHLHGIETINNHSHKDNFYHTLEVLDNISINTNNLWLRWAALLHDIGKPKTKKYYAGIGWTFHAHDFIGAKMIPSIFKKLKLPLNEKMEFVKKMVLLHLRPIVLAQDIVTDSAIRRLLFDAGNDIDDLMTLCDADITSKNPKKVKRYLNNFQLVRRKLKEVEEKDKIRNWKPPIDGLEIMEIFNIPAGKEIGVLKNSIKEAILDGIIANNKQDALIFLLKEAKKLNLKPK